MSKHPILILRRWVRVVIVVGSGGGFHGGGATIVFTFHGVPAAAGYKYLIYWAACNARYEYSTSGRCEMRPSPYLKRAPHEM